MTRVNRRCRMKWSVAVAAAVAATFLGTRPATADDGVPATLQQQNDDLRKRIDGLQQQIDALKVRPAAVPAPTVVAVPATGPAVVVTPPPADDSGTTFKSIFVEQRPIAMPGDVKAGYKDGFYVNQGDTFELKVNALVDVRYTFADVRNKTDLTTTALGRSREAEESGFNLFDAQVSLQGYLFKHGEQEAFYKAMGNFGTLGAPFNSSGGTFVVNELYGGYQFSPGLRVRAGAMVIPFTPLRSTADYGGLTFPDVPDEAVPYIPGFGLGADVLGAVLDNTLSYDVMVGNGSVSQGLTNSTGPLAGRDNRFSAYTREQYALAGKVSDFLDESDVEDHQSPVALVGGGFGYESQTTAADAFPGPQSTLRIPGLSSADPTGFRPPYVVDGNLFRYIGDLKVKYRGFSFFGEGLYQHVSAETPTVVPGFPHHGVGETAYFAQAGYFILPKHLELDGRFGQIYTNGLHHQADIYSFGANYYFFDQKLKLQFAETYIPRQAPLTNNTGAIVNTQDWITQVQAQLKF